MRLSRFAGTKYDGGSDSEVMLGTPAVATVMILDDGHAGIIHFGGTQCISAMKH